MAKAKSEAAKLEEKLEKEYETTHKNHIRKSFGDKVCDVINHAFFRIFTIIFAFPF